ncbi:embryonic protein UVS.2-like [Rhinoderma darwinii]|uniref:embryonic protein UVS.2-like n=1 Tax=Rhinoderma darwinii TaxID=43563 RepID=UPI003F6696A7
MGEKICFLLLLCVAGPVTGVPLSPSLQLSTPGLNEYEIKNEEEDPGTFGRILEANKGNSILIMAVKEGDILIQIGRSAIKCRECLWPKSSDGTVIVPYTLSSDYSDWQRNLIKTSMGEFETLTCVRFVPRTAENDFLNIASSGGCSSSVGREGGDQFVGVDINGCMYRGIIQHELDHGLGFYHEHKRSDRDEYVTIMYENISPDDTGNFNKADTNNLGLPYDYGSVMHYNKYALTINPGEPTIVPKPDPNVPIGQRDGLSVLDVAKINRLYKCKVCANLLNNNNGSLTSANYPSAYPNNANCVWLIRTPSEQVALKFMAFDVESSPNCISDYIKIYDGPTKKSPLLLDRTCGSELIPPIIASTSQLLLEFSSDSSVTRVGFSASYSSVCGGKFYTPDKNITSLGYPNAYPPNLNCVYTITAPVGYRVSLSVNNFQLENIRFCKNDYLKTSDGSIERGPFCGDNKIPTITSTGNTLVLTFVSDSSVQKRGFQASYIFI